MLKKQVAGTLQLVLPSPAILFRLLRVIRVMRMRKALLYVIQTLFPNRSSRDSNADVPGNQRIPTTMVPRFTAGFQKSSDLKVTTSSEIHFQFIPS